MSTELEKIHLSSEGADLCEAILELGGYPAGSLEFVIADAEAQTAPALEYFCQQIMNLLLVSTRIPQEDKSKYAQLMREQFAVLTPPPQLPRTEMVPVFKMTGRQLKAYESVLRQCGQDSSQLFNWIEIARKEKTDPNEFVIESLIELVDETFRNNPPVKQELISYIHQKIGVDSKSVIEAALNSHADQLQAAKHHLSSLVQRAQLVTTEGV